MDNTPVIIVIAVIAVILAIFMIISATRNKQEKRIPNYRALFIIGLSWLPIGIATDNPGLWSIGIVFFVIGLANKNKWGQETKWSDLSPQARKTKIIFVGGLTLLLFIAILYFMLVRTS